MLEECPNCYGDGKEPGEFDELPCPTCEGEGRLEEVPCDVCRTEGCPVCNRQGYLYDINCPTCRGMRYVEKPVRCTQCKGFKTILPPELFST